MEYRSMGNTGVRVSAVGLGTNQFGGKVDQDGVNDIIDAALDLGVNLIDTADVYQDGRSEATLGVALKGRWEKVILATKVYGSTGTGPNDRGASRYHIMSGVEASLRRLQTDHIDLYQIHRWDDDTPIEETLRALDDLITAGKVRYVGASNFLAWQLARANLLAEVQKLTPFATIQNHYHMLERGLEREMMSYCSAHNVGILPYFPLAGGFLTGKYKRDQPAPSGSRGETSGYVQRYMTPTNYSKVEKLTDWAEEHEHTMAELAHAWLLTHPEVCSVISGATKVSQIEENAKAADWRLSDEEAAEVNTVLDVVPDGYA
jgi:aryl-alcohol dehydrogenase-like predicted oxidoreductase